MRDPNASMRVAVVGHVEWVEFARVDRVPGPGDIVHSRETWEGAGGGGAVAAVELLKLAGSADLFTALGDDEIGHRAEEELSDRGLEVASARRAEPQRRAFTFVDAGDERTITVLGDKLVPRRSDPLPWDRLDGADAVYFASGDAGALRGARAARVVVATARELPTLRESEVELDALVASGKDAGERYEPGDLDPPPRVSVITTGAGGGRYETVDGRSGSYAAARVRGPIADAYGCGDSFAAGLTFGLGSGLDLDAALELGARCGAAALSWRGPFDR
jgi:ribokinase